MLITYIYSAKPFKYAINFSFLLFGKFLKFDSSIYSCSDNSFKEWLDIWYENYVINNVKISTRISYEVIINNKLVPLRI